MVFIKLTVQEKHTWKHPNYGIQAHGLAEAELVEAETETEKNPYFNHSHHIHSWSRTIDKSLEETRFPNL